MWKFFLQQTIIFDFRVIFTSHNLLSQFSEIALKPTMCNDGICCRKTFHILIRELNIHYFSLISTWYEEKEWIWTHLSLLEFISLQTSTVYSDLEMPQSSFSLNCRDYRVSVILFISLSSEGREIDKITETR